jgi:hypothetical protein
MNMFVFKNDSVVNNYATVTVQQREAASFPIYSEEPHEYDKVGLVVVRVSQGEDEPRDVDDSTEFTNEGVHYVGATEIVPWTEARGINKSIEFKMEPDSVYIAIVCTPPNYDFPDESRT